MVGAFQAVAEVLYLFVWLFAYMALGLFVLGMMGVAAGVLGAVAATPVLYVAPDVRSYVEDLVLQGDAGPVAPWRLLLVPRHAGIAAAFGLCYLVLFLVLAMPLTELGILDRSLGPVPVFVVVPVTMVLVTLVAVYRVRTGADRSDGIPSRRSFVAQWLAYLSVVVGVATVSPLVTPRYVVPVAEFLVPPI